MGTNAQLIVKMPNGEYWYSFVGSDGYINHMTPILETFYDIPSKAHALIREGNFSMLKNNLDEIEFWGQGPETAPTLEKAVDAFTGSYIYLYQDHIWSMVDKSSKMRLYWYKSKHKSSDFLSVQCGICGREAEILMDDFEEMEGWLAECFLEDVNLHHCCPVCQHMVRNDGQVDLKRVDLKEAHNLRDLIKDRFFEEKVT